MNLSLPLIVCCILFIYQLKGEILLDYTFHINVSYNTKHKKRQCDKWSINFFKKEATKFVYVSSHIPFLSQDIYFLYSIFFKLFKILLNNSKCKTFELIMNSNRINIELILEFFMCPKHIFCIN